MSKTKQEMIEAVAFAALTRRSAELRLEKAEADGEAAHFKRQHKRAINDADRFLRWVTDELAASA